MRSFFVLILLGVILITIALVVRSGIMARRNPGEPINSAMRLAMETPQLTTEDAATVSKKFFNAHHLPSGLMYVERARGHGEKPHVGALVVVNYTGYLLDGTKFDSSYDRGQPFSFEVGLGRVIKGWDEALLDMKEGEKRTLIIPYWLAYGDSGAGKIPPKATLVFDVELVSIH